MSEPGSKTIECRGADLDDLAHVMQAKLSMRPFQRPPEAHYGAFNAHQDLKVHAEKLDAAKVGHIPV